MEGEPKESLLVQIKYYITLTLGLVSCLSCFVFMFCIPFFLEPSISTLVANFDPDPIVCRTVFSEHGVGMKNCTWSSCKHGCTVDQFHCDRIYVDYMLIRFSEYDGTEYDDEESVWAVKGVPVFVNIKACGYPPNTNCSIFADMFGPIGSIFPCYYSRTDPSLVITEYSWETAVHSLIMALIIPNVLTGVSLGILSYWWYPGCQKRSCQYEMPPDQEAASCQQIDTEDDENDEKDDDSSEEEDTEGGSRKKKPKEKKEKSSEELTIKIPPREVC